MINNSKRIMEIMQSSFPHIYNVYDKSTIIYTLLSVFSERYGVRTDIIDRLYAMIGIDSTYDEDLEHRWGSLLRIYRQPNESYADYRSRLLITYSSLAGGTAEAIKYAIASTVGITSDPDAIDEYIKVYDAWEYPYDVSEDINTSYGHIICTVDLQANEGVMSTHVKILDAINKTKASGIMPYLIFLYNTNDAGSLLHNKENIYDTIYENISENRTLPSYGFLNSTIFGNTNHMTDMFFDKMSYSSHESAIIGINNSWNKIGTNSAIINVNLITNMLTEADEHIDKIIQ